MIKIQEIMTYGWEEAIRGMRNPMNSWGYIDTGWVYFEDKEPKDYIEKDDEDSWYKLVGKNDLNLMKKLGNAGSDHGKYLRMITVYMDITAPLYWWKEFDTYKVGTVANSCSTMHKIHAKEFTLDDFSHEHLLSTEKNCVSGEAIGYATLEYTVMTLNFYRKLYLETKNKDYWWQMIQLLPSSYNQKRTVQLNYQVLKNMYHARKNHKLDEWHKFCEMIEELPYSELITGKEG